MIPKNHCETCKFYDATSPTQGACRRFPPSAHLAGMDKVHGPQIVSAFAPTKATDWCGEHKVDILEATSMPIGMKQ